MADNKALGACMDLWAMFSSIYIKDHYTLLHTKYKSSGPCGFGEDFLCFSHEVPRAGPVWTPGHGWQDLYRGPLYIATHKI